MCPAALPLIVDERSAVRGLGLDVHRDFCEVAIAENGRVRSAGRIATRVAALELFAASLAADDVVALEATTGADRIVAVLQRHGIRVVVANTRKLKAITEARAKTDRLDARTLAKLLMTGLLEPVWTPDERTRALRRLTNRRERIVRARTRAKNEAHGVLSRNLCERPPVTDAFGKAGRQWLADLELPADERLTLDGCLRQVDFLDREVAAIDREIAKQTLAWPQVLRLMTVPGVNVHTAATFMAAIGDIRRFPSARQLVSYLGLDPRVRQSGNSPARHGRISKAGASETRHMLGEVAWKVMLTPGPLRAFFERVRARRGPQIAATATARKLTVLFWHMLTREQDYAFGRPAMTRNKIRKLELLAGAPPQKGRHGIAGGKSKAVSDAERELSRQAEAGYRRLVNDWQATKPTTVGAGATPGRASQRPPKGKAARQAI
ncbi:MAG TPA: IS110 family transposase [Solirubrobacteraceae bacterium]|nr:IS110 family transposase [Solirubrobacteraceae bacterium]